MIIIKLLKSLVKVKKLDLDWQFCHGIFLKGLL
jgi:hypothetical protein